VNVSIHVCQWQLLRSTLNLNAMFAVGYKGGGGGGGNAIRIASLSRQFSNGMTENIL
jgi:hypothetical protein